MSAKTGSGVYEGGTDLKQRAQAALADDQLRAAVALTTDRLRNGRLRAIEELGDWETWRERARAIRAHTIAHLDYYLGRFADEVERSGGVVHFCATAEEAVAVVLGIVREKSARVVAKSKSMVSEEIHLNEALEREGVAVIETDLGEYIIQLAGEKPSHLIIPAIHRNRQQIAELFSRVSGETFPPDTKALAGYARRRLREWFLKADIGLTGCNFGIAESGTITLVSNEGNARMVTTLPRTHIVVMGMERIVPTFADVEVMLNMLARSATGQKLTVYTSFITGPRRRGEADGPDELHVVVLDNGRSAQLGDPQFQEVLHCIRCAACLNVCPVYRHIGGHAYGSVYSGPIGAVLTPLLANDPAGAGELAYASSLCGACYEACPVKIPLHDMLVYLRGRRVRMKLTPRGERIAFRLYRRAFTRAELYRAGVKATRLMLAPFARGGRIRRGPGPLAGWTKSRTLPALPGKTFRERWKELENEPVEPLVLQTPGMVTPDVSTSGVPTAEGVPSSDASGAADRPDRSGRDGA